MLKDIQRFNKQASQLASSVKAFHAGTTATADTDPTSDAWNEPLEQFLDRNCYGIPFRRDYLLPMAAAIWSCPKSTMAQFPIGSFVRFFNNHGLLQITDRPQWFTVAGGSKHYVAAIEKALLSKHQTIYRNSPVMRVDRHPSGVTLHSAQGAQEFDAVVMACHSDQALKLLKEPSPIEQEQLGAIKYQVNQAYLHTDARLMPRRKQAWAAWNYLSDSKTADESQVCVTYWLNRLQPLPCGTDLFVSLNPLTEPEPGKTLSRIEYAHPIFDRQAMQAQRQFGALQGQKHTWYAGAWLGYGFHEDGLSSGLAAARRIEDHLATQSHNPPASLAA